FCALVEQVYANPMDRNRPLWQMWVVEGLEGGRVALVTLFHHAYTDGIGAIEMMQNVFNEALEDTPRGPAAWEPGPLPSPSRRLAWALRDLPALLRKVPLTGPPVRARGRVRLRSLLANPADGNIRRLWRNDQRCVSVVCGGQCPTPSDRRGVSA